MNEMKATVRWISQADFHYQQKKTQKTGTLRLAAAKCSAPSENWLPLKRPTALSS